MRIRSSFNAFVVDILKAVGFIGDWRAYGWTNALVLALLAGGVVACQVGAHRAVQLFIENALAVGVIVFFAAQAEKLRLAIQ